MTDFQSRVIEERDALIVKLEKLRAFTSSSIFESLHPQDAGLLNQQAAFMAQYLHTLEMRIARFF